MSTRSLVILIMLLPLLLLLVTRFPRSLEGIGDDAVVHSSKDTAVVVHDAGNAKQHATQLLSTEVEAVVGTQVDLARIWRANHAAVLITHALLQQRDDGRRGAKLDTCTHVHAHREIERGERAGWEVSESERGGTTTKTTHTQ